MKLMELTESALQAFYDDHYAEYKAFQAQNLSLDMTRGKPCVEQLNLALGVLETLKARSEFANSKGDDCRNYGVWNGLPEMRALFSDMMDVPKSQIILGNNSSLQMMFSCITKGFTHGYSDCVPWGRQERLKFLCPSPGYDRHFAITEYYGFEMIMIPMLATGPDMDLIERLVEKDDTIKGCWCVPKYSNPTGVTFSDETVRRFAKLRPAAKDFRIMWDNAYCVHDLGEESVPLLDLYAECQREGTEDQVLYFASTSKISFPGAGVAAVGMSPSNLKEMKDRITVETIGPDKLNQLRHVLFLHNIDGVKELMQGHRAIIGPKFQLVDQVLQESLGACDIARWNQPKGGYFVNLDVMNGCAKRVITLCAQAGVALTAAGAAFPYGCDPNDSNIRLAPTFPSMEELKTAMAVVCTCVEVAAAEKLLKEKRMTA